MPDLIEFRERLKWKSWWPAWLLKLSGSTRHIKIGQEWIFIWLLFTSQVGIENENTSRTILNLPPFCSVLFSPELTRSKSAAISKQKAVSPTQSKGTTLTRYFVDTLKCFLTIVVFHLTQWHHFYGVWNLLLTWPRSVNLVQYPYNAPTQNGFLYIYSVLTWKRNNQ